jgi:hypothetical protein
MTPLRSITTFAALVALAAGCRPDLPETDWAAQRPVNVPGQATYVGKYSAERSLVPATGAVGALEVEDGSREAFEAGGRVVRFVPNVAGRVWVVSGQNGLVMLSEQLKKNDRLLVDPRGNRLRINGAEVYARRVGTAGNEDNPYVFYFLPDAAK